jgi:AcrR family transcriptional regulator
MAILDAVDALFLPSPGAELLLEAVAERAGTTVQTVLRHFGTKTHLLEAAARRGLEKVKADRAQVPAGDLAAAAAYLARHYEESGAMVLRMLAVEEKGPQIAQIAQDGRDMHRAWVERVLAPLIGALTGGARRRRVALLVAVTDVLTWKVLRIDQGLSQRDYQHSVTELLEAIQ